MLVQYIGCYLANGKGLIAVTVTFVGFYFAKGYTDNIHKGPAHDYPNT